MNIVISTAITILFTSGIVLAQPPEMPEKTQEQITASKEYELLVKEWKELSGVENVGRGDVFTEIHMNIKNDYPMDPKILKQVEEITKKRDEAMEAKAKELGYRSASEAFQAGNNEVQAIYTESINRITPLTQPYYDELNYRYHLSAVDALRRLIGNAKTMK